MTTPTQGFNVGNATGYIDIDPSGVRTGINEAKQQLGSFRQQLGSFVANTGEQIRNFGAQWTALAAPIALAMGAGLKLTASFDASLQEIKARAGLTEDALEQVRNKALELGADTAFSTQQAADAFLQLMTAGMSLDDIMREDAESLTILDHVLAGAAASGEDLGLVADQVTNIMSSFSLEVTEAARIVNAMSQAAASSPASMGEMGEALQLIGGDARSFGLSLEQTSASLAIMAQNGKRGSEAANQLKSIFTAMISQAPKTQQAWSMVNSSLFDAQGNSRDFAVVLAEVKSGLENLNAEEQAFVIQQLAGSYGRVGFQALLASDGIESMIETMDGQTSAAEVAEQRMNTFQGKITSLAGSIQTLAITTLTPFMNNVLLPIVNMLIDVTNAVTSWASENEVLVQNIMVLMAVFVGLGPVIMVVGQAIMFLGGAIAFWLSPIGLVVAAVAGLVFMFRDRLIPIVQQLQDIFSANGLGGGLRWLFAQFEDGSTVIGSFLEQLGLGAAVAQRFGWAITGAINGVWTILRTFVEDLRSFGLGEAILSLFGRGQTSGDSALEGLFFRMGFSREKAIELTNNIFSVFSLWFVRVRSLFTRLGNTLSQIPSFISNITGAVSTAVAPIITWVSSWLSLSDVLAGLGAYIGTLLLPVLISVGTFIGGTLVSIIAGLVATFAPVIAIIAAVALGLSLLRHAWHQNFLGIQNIVENVFTRITRAFTYFTRIASAAFNMFKAILESTQSPLLALGITLTSFTGNTGFLMFFSNLRDTLRSFASFLFDNVIPNLQLFFSLLQMGADPLIAFGHMLARITSNPDILRFFINLSNTINNVIIPALQSGLEAVGNFISGLFNAFQAGGFAGAGTFIQDNLITPLLNSIQTTDWNQVGLNILNGIGAALSLLWQASTWIYDNFISPLISSAITTIQTTDWAAIGNSIMAAIGTALSTTFSFLVWINDNILQPMISNAATAIENVDWFSVGQNIVNAIGAALTATFDFIAWIVNSIFSPITSNTDAATGQVDWGGVGTSIMNAIGSALQAVGDFMTWVTVNILAPLALGAVSAIQSYDWSGVGTGLMDAIRNALPNIVQWVQTNIIQPVQSALSGFNPFNSFGGGSGPSLPAPGSPPVSFGSGGAANPALGLINPILPMMGVVSNIMGSFASGIDFVPKDMIAQIHEGEAVIPASRNPNNPNASSPSGGGDTIGDVYVTVQANNIDMQNAEEIGGKMGRGFLSEYRKRGGR